MRSNVMTHVEDRDSTGQVPPSGTTLRVFIYEQCEIFRAGMRAVIEDAPDMTVAGEAADPESTTGNLLTASPSAVLFGLTSLHSTLRTTQSIRSILRIPFPTVVVGEKIDHDAIIEVLAAGVRGVLHRDVSATRLKTAIRTVVDGGLVLGPCVADRLVATIVGPGQVDLAQQVRRPPDAFRTLTPRQQEVLRLVADGLTNTEIARRMHVSVATVKSHLSETLQKLAVRDRTQLAVLAHQYGLTRPTGGGSSIGCGFLGGCGPLPAPADQAAAFRPSASRPGHGPDPDGPHRG